MKRRFGRLAVLLLALCLCISPANAFADGGDAAPADPAVTEPSGTVLSKVLVTISYSSPVVFGPVNYISAATSTAGCSVNCLIWYDSAGNRVTTETFEKFDTYHMVLRIDAVNGCTIAPDAAVYLNNSRTAAQIDSSGTGLVITRDIQSVYWKPSIYTQPKAKTVTEGDKAKFVVSGGYYSELAWKLVSPDGKLKLSCEEAKESFIGLEVSGADKTTLTLSEIPLEMNGWKVYCTLKNDGGSADSNAAKLTVKADPSKTPEPTPAPTPTASPKPTATPEPSPTPAPTAAPTPTQASVPTEVPTPSQTPAAENSQSGITSIQMMFFGIMALVVLAVVLIIIQGVNENKRRGRRR